ncbi:hypothetical protein EPI10_020590 [Gossypium australe]|uniref:Uncharacterized protein n=1 Tax=Gossypium australe TaxID=47621 RepID=A0A5B6WFD9_9ROSI|nr:hypothetical protein EPI10_020590 [Gossypium australe]
MDRRSTTGYCSVVSQGAKSKYRAMTQSVCEIMMSWNLKSLHQQNCDVTIKYFMSEPSILKSTATSFMRRFNKSSYRQVMSEWGIN